MGNVTIKGNGDGLEIVLSEKATYPGLREELLGKLRKHQSFFQNTDMRVVIRGKDLSQAQRKELKRVFAMDFGINDVLYGDEADLLREVERNMKQAARAASKPKPQEGRETEPELVTRCEPDAKSTFVMGTVRNGRRIESDGDVVVLGDVNPGAEIMAGGSIAIFGKLRGLAHAGCSGSQPDACIAAISLSPKQLRIAGHILSFSEERDTTGPEVAQLDQTGKVVIRAVGTRSR